MPMARSTLLVLALLCCVLSRPAVAGDVVVTEVTRAPDRLLLQVEGPPVEEVYLLDREILILYREAIEPRDVDALVEGREDWIETVEYGFDSFLVRFGPEIEIAWEQGDGAVTVTASRIADEAVTASASDEAVDPQLIRLNFYRALTLIESGSVHEGRAILVQQRRLDPRNIEVLLLLAQAEERLDRPRHAIRLYDEVLALDPRLDRAIRDRRRLAVQEADTVRIATRYQDVTNGETQIITTLDGRLSSDSGFRLDYEFQTRDVDTGSLTRPNGDIRGFEGDRQRGALTLSLPAESLGRLSASLYGSNQVVGAGLGLDLDTGPTEWSAGLTWSEPNYDFVEGIVEGGARDQATIGWRTQLGDIYQLALGGEINRYTLDGDHAGASVGISAEARRVLYTSLPYLTVGYQLNAEYYTNSQISYASGSPLLPLGSTEVHSLDIGIEDQVTDYLRARAFAGYSYDRLNGTGPLAEVELTYAPLVDLEVTFSMGSSLTASRGTDNQLIYGGLSVRTRF